MLAEYIDMEDGTAIAGDHRLARDNDGWWGLDLVEAGHLGDPNGDLQGDAWWRQASWVRGQTLGHTPDDSAAALAALLTAVAKTDPAEPGTGGSITVLMAHPGALRSGRCVTVPLYVVGPRPVPAGRFRGARGRRMRRAALGLAHPGGAGPQTDQTDRPWLRADWFDPEY